MRPLIVVVVLATPALAQVSQAPLKTTDQVTVTADRTTLPEGQTSKTVYTLTEDQLQQYPSLDLDETLRQHAGFELFRRAPSRIANPTSEGISLRGLGSTAVSRTLVLIDGAPLNDPFGGWIHWNELPQQTIQTVTLVTGGGSDLYGSSALGGVIDVTPETPRTRSFDLYGAGGSQDTSNLQSTGTFTTPILNGLFAGESLRTNGYVTTAPALAGAVDTPANVRSQAYRTELGRRDDATKRLFLTGNLLNENRNNGTPLTTNGTRLWRYLAGYDLPDTARTASRIRSLRLPGGLPPKLLIHLRQPCHRDPHPPPARPHPGARSLCGLHRPPLGPLRRCLWSRLPRPPGHRSRKTDHCPPPGTSPPANASSAASANSWPSTSSTPEAVSLRADRASNLDIHQPAGVTQPNRTEVLLSPRLGVTRTLGSLANIHASAFRAFREPSMNELYRTGQVGQEITLANPALTSERATGWEIGSGVHTPSNNLALQATYFWTEINHPVSAVLISQTATTLTNLRENLGQIRSRGVELAATLYPTRPLSATLGYQYADSTVTQFNPQPTLVGKRIPQVPRPLLHRATASDQSPAGRGHRRRPRQQPGLRRCQQPLSARPLLRSRPQCSPCPDPAT